MILYGVVDWEIEKAVELFVEREQAERFIAEVEEDHPEVAAAMTVEKIKLG